MRLACPCTPATCNMLAPCPLPLCLGKQADSNSLVGFYLVDGSCLFELLLMVMDDSVHTHYARLLAHLPSTHLHTLPAFLPPFCANLYFIVGDGDGEWSRRQRNHASPTSLLTASLCIFGVALLSPVMASHPIFEALTPCLLPPLTNARPFTCTPSLPSSPLSSQGLLFLSVYHTTHPEEGRRSAVFTTHTFLTWPFPTTGVTTPAPWLGGRGTSFCLFLVSLQP